MPSIATISSFALFALTALVERAVSVPQQGMYYMYGWAAVHATAAEEARTAMI